MADRKLNSRRRFLLSAAAGSTLVLGCKPVADEETKPSTPVTRRDVPLRVLLCGNERWADTLKTAWSGIAEQPLQITVLDPRKLDAAEWQSSVIKANSMCDVAIVPSGLIPALDSVSGITPPNEEWLGPEGVDAASMYPMLREGLMKFAGRQLSVPLGAIQPALAAAASAFEGKAMEMPSDWGGYIELAKQLNANKPDDAPESVVAEPLADGAAGKMFLWRASSADPTIWLFDRESFEPVIDGEQYVEALESMKQCVALYGNARLTDGEVWSQMASGRLKLAIAWPAIAANAERIEEITDWEFSSFPPMRGSSQDNDATLSASPVPTLLDIDSPVAILSSHCRQSDSAKGFMKWLVGGEGTGMIKNAVTGLTNVRGSSSSDSARTAARDADENGSSEESNATQYNAVLASALSSLRIRTPLQLLEYRQYAKALDEAVLRCLDGKQTASEALSSAASDWKNLTNKIGKKEQMRAWRRAQGLRS